MKFTVASDIPTWLSNTPRRQSWELEMKTGRWENSFVHSKIGYVRSQVEPLARNAPRFQFSPASSQQNYRKITLLLAKKWRSAARCRVPQNSCHPIEPSAAARNKLRSRFPPRRLHFSLCAGTNNNWAIIFQLQILHLLKYECISAFVYGWKQCGWRLRTFQAVRKNNVPDDIYVKAFSFHLSQHFVSCALFRKANWFISRCSRCFPFFKCKLEKFYFASCLLCCWSDEGFMLMFFETMTM